MNHQRSLFLSSLVVTAMTAVFTASVVHARPLAAPAGVLTQDEDWVTVEVEGRGETVKAAIQDAIANGLRKIVGEYVTTETVVENDEIVEDVVRSFTVGQQVLTEPVGDPRFEGTTVVVVMKVSAEPREINAKFEKAAASAVYMDGETLAAEIEFAANNVEKQREILVELTRDLPARLLVARLIDREGTPIDAGRIPKEDIKRLPDGSHVVALNIECYFDLESWYRKVEPRLREALSAMAIEAHPAALSIECFTNQRKSHLFSPHPYWGTNMTGGGAMRSRLPEGTRVPFGHAGLFVSRARDAEGRSETFDFYLLPKSLMVFEATRARRGSLEPLLELGIIAVDRDGQLLNRWTTPILRGVIASRNRKVGDAFPVSNAEHTEWAAFPQILYCGGNEYAPSTIIDVEGGSGSNPENGWVGLLTPRFGTGVYNSGWESVSDVCVLRLELTMPAGHLEDLAAFVFDPTTFGDGSSGSPRELGQPQKRRRPPGSGGDPRPGGRR